MAAITLEESKNRAICETTKRYWVLLYGEQFDELFWNIKGYRGALPVPSESDKRAILEVGEWSLTRVKKEIRELNKEWAEFENRKEQL